ncbi:NHL repeat-containing protein [soil metagenome]
MSWRAALCGMLAISLASGCVPQAVTAVEEPMPIGDLVMVVQEGAALAAVGSSLYVVDRAAATLTELRQDDSGALRSALAFGGRGSGDYALMDPGGLDPTNGLVFLIADAGNGRIQRIGHDGRWLGSVAVPPAEPGGMRPSDRRDAGRSGEGAGRPIDVAMTPDGSFFVIDESRRAVAQISSAGRLERLIGADGPNTLGNPVSLVIGNDSRLYVADRDLAAVGVFDVFGTFLRFIPAEGIGMLRSVSISTDYLIIVGAEGIAVHHESRGFLDTLHFGGRRDLVDAAIMDGSIYILTTGGIHRIAVPPLSPR